MALTDIITWTTGNPIEFDTFQAYSESVYRKQYKYDHAILIVADKLLGYGGKLKQKIY